MINSGISEEFVFPWVSCRGMALMLIREKEVSNVGIPTWGIRVDSKNFGLSGYR